MALSEEEQRILEQIERELVRDDPEFVRQVEETSVFRHSMRALLRWAALLVLGLILVFVGLLSAYIPLSVVGFVVCVLAVLGAFREIAKVSKAARHSLLARFSTWSAGREQGASAPGDLDFG